MAAAGLDYWAEQSLDCFPLLDFYGDGLLFGMVYLLRTIRAVVIITRNTAETDTNLDRGKTNDMVKP